MEIVGTAMGVAAAVQALVWWWELKWDQKEQADWETEWAMVHLGWAMDWEMD